ncbi:MAG: RagB/SusD family nutrient uptake outer membrane protein [Bacteroidota bacterium]
MYRTFLLLSLSLLFTQCQQLQEEDLNDTFLENRFNQPNDFILAAGKAYERLGQYTNLFGTYYLQGIQTDEMIMPGRGPNASSFPPFFIELHLHEMTSANTLMEANISLPYAGIEVCNERIALFEQQDPAIAAPFIAEMRVLRALFYTWLMDIFGNVGLHTTTERFTTSTQVARSELFRFIEQEILESLDALPKTIGGEGYAKINYYTAQALLAQLYLNAEVYTGTPNYDAAQAACDAIISDGGYQLEADYFANFKVDNQNSQEIIFAIPFDEGFMNDFQLHLHTLHPSSRTTYNFSSSAFLPGNLISTTPEFYALFSDDDLRGAGFIAGPQFGQDGLPLLDFTDGDRDPDGSQINFTPSILSITDALQQDGVRIGKFEFEEGASTGLNNDFPLFRYAEILLNKAEALWRKNPSDAVALELVNQVRARAGLGPFEALTAENLLAERGRELAFEGKRRADMIRFGTFGEARGFKAFSEPCRTLAPIPLSVIFQSAWQQNPCY